VRQIARVRGFHENQATQEIASCIDNYETISILDATLKSKALFRRLRDHLGSIEEVGSLASADFHFRCLVVDDIWIPLGETLLLHKYQPLWNQVVEGFGNHDPGKGRHAGCKPAWDELHPGRSWAKNLQPPKLTKLQILGAVEAHLRARPK
jgi:hypothetical protein